MSAAPGNALGRLVAPWALFAGLAAGFTACCLAGRLAAGRNPFEGFQRFHPLLAPETLFYPTACQVRALAQSRLDPHKIAVVVGGSSILHGARQTVAQVWTKKLQALLGDQYQVINLGFRGAWTAEFGATAAEMLAKDYPKLILVSDLHPGLFQTDPDGVQYKYFFWDANCKGLLLADPARDARLGELAGEAERLEQEIGRGTMQKSGLLTAEQQAELRAQMRLDSRLYFRDLWNTLAYTHFFTVWTAPARLFAASAGQDDEWFTSPRQVFRDGDPGSPPPPARDEGNPAVVQGLHEHLPGLCERRSGRWKENRTSGDWRTFDRWVVTAFPPEVRPRTLLLVTWFSPYLLGRLSAEEQVCYARVSGLTRRHLERAGFPTLEVGRGYTPADYADWHHLAAPGGARLAAQVAPRVRALARQLGYLK
jgi:hypothetical protein